MSTAARSMAWGDEDDDDYLPPRQESAVDAKGVKTVVEYSFNDAGQKTKTTTKVLYPPISSTSSEQALLFHCTTSKLEAFKCMSVVLGLHHCCHITGSRFC